MDKKCRFVDHFVRQYAARVCKKAKALGKVVNDVHIERSAEKEVLTTWLLHMCEVKGQKINQFEWKGFRLTSPEIEACAKGAVDKKNAAELS